jgi:DNA-binding NarL/FixJ family response regulator
MCPMQICVVILSGQALFAEGIASRLRQYLQLEELEIVDAGRPDAMAQIAAVRLSVVILDVTDSEVTELCPLSQLLFAFPKLKVICLNPQQAQVQVVTSKRHAAVDVRDLAAVIEWSA